MSKMSEHPTVKKYYETNGGGDRMPQGEVLDAAYLRELAIECGADDAGLVELDRPGLEPEKAEVLGRYPWAKSLLSFVVRMNREQIRSTARSVANLEFHHSGDDVNEVSRHIVRKLEGKGVRAVSPSMGFPMEMTRYPNRIWVIAHKPVAVAAGLGHMGIHRNVIHPKFGNFILLGTVILEARATEYDGAIDYNPCLECNLCVAACPVGAISNDGGFDFNACYNHNYREFMGGFTDWIEQLTDSSSALDYRTRMDANETASFWQSLSFGPNYKSAYCMAVCPAGEDVIGPFLRDKKTHFKDVVKPLIDKEEVVYVTEGTDAEAHVKKRFKHKHVKYSSTAIRPRSARAFLNSMALMFQKGQAEGLDAVYHFTFTGAEDEKGTVLIRDKTISVRGGHVGKADLRVTANTDTWLGFLAGEKSLVWALLTLKIRLKGSPKLLAQFGKCFPSQKVRHKKGDSFTELPVSKGIHVAKYKRNEATGGARG